MAGREPLLESRGCGRRRWLPVEEENQAKRFYVSGVVQGVGYRYFAQRTAGRLGLAGYARNLPDGRVEVYAIGPAVRLETLRSELEQGPRSASVAEVMEEEAEIDRRYARGFSIEHDGW